MSLIQENMFTTTCRLNRKDVNNHAITTGLWDGLKREKLLKTV